MATGWRRFFPVEPVIFLYTYGLMMSLPVYQQYVYSRASEQFGLPYSYDKEEKQGGCATDAGNGTNSSLSLADMERKVQSRAAGIELGVVMFSTLPSILSAIMIGAWTDKAGRRIGIALPCLGTMIDSLLMIIMIYKKWPLWTMFVGSAISGLCGYLTLLQVAIMAYIADTCNVSKLPLRIALLQMLLFMGGMVSQLTSGLWIRAYGFIAPYWFIFACQAISFVYVVFLLPESRKATQEKISFWSCYSFRKVFCIFKRNKARPSAQRNLLMLNLSSGVMTMTTMGVTGVSMLFILRSPLCLSATMVGYFMAYRFALQGIGSVVTVAFVGRFVSQINTVRLGLLSHIAALVFFGFSDRLWMIFLVSIIGFFDGAVEPIYRGMMSRTVDIDQQGAMFAAVGVISTLFQFIGTFVFNGIYPRALAFGFPGFVFVLAGVFTIIPLVLMNCLRETSTLVSKGRPLSVRRLQRAKAGEEGVALDEDKQPESPTSESPLSCETGLEDNPTSKTETEDENTRKKQEPNTPDNRNTRM